MDKEAHLRTVDMITKALASKKEAVLLKVLEPGAGDKTMPLQDLVQLLAGLAGEEDGALLSMPDSRISGMRNARRTRTSQGELLPKLIVGLPTSFSSLTN